MSNEPILNDNRQAQIVRQVSAAIGEGVLLSDFHQSRIAEELVEAARESCEPHALMRPRIYPDGDQWCALYGEDLQEGVAGFGVTPAAACLDFNTNWRTQRLNSKACEDCGSTGACGESCPRWGSPACAKRTK